MRRRLHSQSGIALPVAVLVLGLVLLLAGIAIASAVRSNRQTVQDLRVKAALQAANAGADLARSRMQLLNLQGSLVPTAPCINLSADGLVSTVGAVTGSVTSVLGSLLSGMCAPVHDVYANGAESDTTIVTFQNDGNLLTNLLGNVFGTLLNVNRTIVAQGTYQGVTRRVAVDVKLTTSTRAAFAGWALQSLEAINLPQGQDRYGSIRSNGSIAVGANVGIGSTSAPGAGPNCTGATSGDAIPGPGATLTLGAGAVACRSTTPATAAFSLPPFDTADVAAANSNTRLTMCYSGNVLGGLISDWCPSRTIDWDADAKTLRLTRLAPGGLLGLGLLGPPLPTLTVRGSAYYLCKLEIRNDALLVVPSGVTTRFVIDKRLCPAGTTNPGTFTVDGTGGIDTDAGTSASTQIYVVGDGGASISTSRSQALTLYAPDSRVTLAGGTRITGAIAAKSIVGSGPRILVRPDATTSGVGFSSTSFQASNFRECLVVANPSGPMAGCERPGNA